MHLSHDETIFPVWVALMASIFAYLVEVKIIQRRLKTRFPTQWEAIGKPTLFINNSIKNTILFFNFFIKKNYYLLNDEKINLYFYLLRIFLFISVALLAACIIMMFAIPLEGISF